MTELHMAGKYYSNQCQAPKIFYMIPLLTLRQHQVTMAFSLFISLLHYYNYYLHFQFWSRNAC